MSSGAVSVPADWAQGCYGMPAADRLRVCQALNLPTNDLQDRIVGSRKRNVLFRAAPRVGKSWSMAKRHFPLTLLPNTRHWIVGPTYGLARKEFLYIHDMLQLYEKKFLKDVGPAIINFRDNPSNGELYIRTGWHAEIEGKSATHRKSLKSEALDSIIMAEASELDGDIYEQYCVPRLVTKRGYLSIGSSPHEAGQWLYNLELKALEWPDEWDVFTQTMYECGHIALDEIESLKNRLSSEAFREQVLGEWTFYGGRPYAIFRPDVHLVDPFPIPRSWKHVCAVDWSATGNDQTGGLWGAIAPSGELYLFAEYYVGQKERPGVSTEDHVHSMLDVEEMYDILPGNLTRISDHHGLAGALILTASRAGFRTAPCRSNDRRARRDAAMAAFASRPNRHPYWAQERGLPKGDYPNVFVFKGRCPSLQREMQFLRYRETTGISTIDTTGPDHLIDPMEYMIEYWRIGESARRKTHRVGGVARINKRFDLTGYYAYGRSA